MPYNRTGQQPAFDFTALINMWKTAQADANAANEARYTQLLQMYGNTPTSMVDMINQYGTAAKNRISTNMQTGQAQAASDLAARGLNIPGVTRSVQRGLRSDAETQMLSVGEAQNRQMAGAMGGKLLTVANKTDQAPDASMFSSLLQAAAAGNAGTTAGFWSTPASNSAQLGLRDRLIRFRSSLGL